MERYKNLGSLIALIVLVIVIILILFPLIGWAPEVASRLVLILIGALAVARLT